MPLYIVQSILEGWMTGDFDKQIKINTYRNALYRSDYTELKKEIKDIEKKAESIVDWIINKQEKLSVVPIVMRKAAAYAAKLTIKVLMIPLVLRKRVMYERIMNG